MNRTLRTSFTFVVVIAVFATLTVRSGAARADDTDRLGSPTTPDAQELLDKGNRHYRVGEFEKAVELYVAPKKYDQRDGISVSFGTNGFAVTGSF